MALAWQREPPSCDRRRMLSSASCAVICFTADATPSGLYHRHGRCRRGHFGDRIAVGSSRRQSGDPPKGLLQAYGCGVALVCRLFRQSGYGDFSCAEQLKSVVWWRPLETGMQIEVHYVWPTQFLIDCAVGSKRLRQFLRRRPACTSGVLGSARQRLRVQRNCGGTTKASRTPQELHTR
jgi:hypothetical protein